MKIDRSSARIYAPETCLSNLSTPPNLNERGLATTRLSTDASKNNPVIALDKTIHKEVNAAQRALEPRAQSGADNIASNAQILRDNPNIPNTAVDEVEGAARAHNDSLESE